MQFSPELQSQISTLSMVTQSVGSTMVSPETINKMFELISVFQNKPEVFEEFKKNPELIVARELGAFGSPLTHFHTADKENNYIPSEGGAAAQIMQGEADPDKAWVRIEVRAGVGPLCWFNCGVCDNNFAT